MRIALLLVLSLLSYQRVGVFASDLTLWQDAARVSSSPRVLINYGSFLVQAGRLAEAVPVYRRAVASAQTWPLAESERLHLANVATQNLQIVTEALQR